MMGKNKLQSTTSSSSSSYLFAASYLLLVLLLADFSQSSIAFQQQQQHQRTTTTTIPTTAANNNKNNVVGGGVAAISALVRETSRPSSGKFRTIQSLVMLHSSSQQKEGTTEETTTTTTTTTPTTEAAGKKKTDVIIPVTRPSAPAPIDVSSSNNNNNSNEQPKLYGGYTAKQRLREEVESPFRKVRFVFFISSLGSAVLALYFSLLSTIKAMAGTGTYVDAPPSMEEALQSDAINLGAAIICGVLAYRDYQAGQANLQRIAKGGQLAKLIVQPTQTTTLEDYTISMSSSSSSSSTAVASTTTTEQQQRPRRQTLSDYRRKARVLIAAGNAEYIKQLSLSLNSDQLKDTNNIPEQLFDSDVIVVPVLLLSKDNNNEGDNNIVVASDTQSYWNSIEVMSTTTDDDEKESSSSSSSSSSSRNYDVNRSNWIIKFPIGNIAWTQYLESEIETAIQQGFDVLNKGITITVKKNGRILRRTTGQPSWSDFINTMEVLDGSKFGMPGDTERYGGA